MARAHANRILRDGRGSAAVEFAIVGPVFLAMTVGMIYTCLMLFSMGSLQYAVEEGARCASVKTLVCTSATATQTYAASVYYGPFTAPTFTSTNATCGHQVSGSTTFSFNIVVSTLSVPLTATSCFP
jgi:Flp pilus assembly protein TadG